MEASSKQPSQPTRVKPGEFLKRKMQLNGLTPSSLAKEIDVHVQTIYNVTAGKRPISHQLAVKLAKRFVEQVDFWLSEEIELAPVDLSHATRLAMPLNVGGDKEAFGNVLEMPLFARPAPLSGGILIDHEIMALLQKPGSGVSITPFNPDNVQPASLDLSVGLIVEQGFRNISQYDWVTILKHELDSSALSARDNERIENLLDRMNDEDLVTFSRSTEIAPLKSVVIIARELVQFDRFHLADVGGTARNALEGLFVNHGFQIDPGYSGAMFFTAINIGMDPIQIATGRKLVSLAIRRLSRAPDRAYHDDVERQVKMIAIRMDEALKAMFKYKQLGNGEYKASSAGFDETFIGASLDDAQDTAVSQIVKDLSDSYQKPSMSHGLLQAVHNAIESVTLDRTDAEALIDHFKILDRDLANKVLSTFRMKGVRQTLRDTLSRLNLDPIQCLVMLIDGD